MVHNPKTDGQAVVHDALVFAIILPAVLSGQAVSKFGISIIIGMQSPLCGFNSHK